MKTTSMSDKLGWTAEPALTAPVVLILALLFPPVALAYVDPGSGSVIVTTILGLIAAIGYTFRKYFYQFKRMSRGKKAEKEEHKDDE